MARLRKGQRQLPPRHWGAGAHFLRETVGRVRHGGARGQLTVRADQRTSRLTHDVVAVSVARRSVPTSPVTVPILHQSLRNIIEAIPEEDWTPMSLLDGRRRRCGFDYAELRDLASSPSEPEAPVPVLAHRTQDLKAHDRLPNWSASSPTTAITHFGSPIGMERPHRPTVRPTIQAATPRSRMPSPRPQVSPALGLNHLPSGRFPANGAWNWPSEVIAAQLGPHGPRASRLGESTG